MMIKLHKEKTILVHDGENAEERLAETILEDLIEEGYPASMEPDAQVVVENDDLKIWIAVVYDSRGITYNLSYTENHDLDSEDQGITTCKTWDGLLKYIDEYYY